MPNPFDQFDNVKVNPFDRFDLPQPDMMPSHEVGAETQQPEPWKQKVSEYAHMGLPAAGAAVGGVIGAGAGAATGPGAPVASPMLGAAGGTLGYSIGERSADVLDELMGLRESGTLSAEASKTLGDLVEGAQFEMGGQAIGAVGGKLLKVGAEKLAAKRVGAATEDLAGVQKNVLEAEAAEKATGIPIYKAQKTGVPTQLEQQAFVGQLPAGTRKAAESLRKQNAAAGKAVDELLNTIATPESVVVGPERFRSAAQKAVDARKSIRSEKVSPIYEEAYTAGAEVNLKPVHEMIDVSVKDFPEGGEVSKSLLRVKSLISGESPTLKQLHNAKLEIDQMVSKFGENSLGNTTKREIITVKNELLARMDEASPKYKEARDLFSAESPSVSALEDSIVGKLSRVEDTQLKSISKRILDPSETNPLVMRKAKKVITDADPEAWDMIVRAEIERRVGSIKPTSDVGVENVPGQIYRAVFGNEKQSRVLFEAVEGEAKKNLKFLETALRRARMGRATGSQTAAREEIKKELRGGVSQSIREWVKSPISKTAGVGEDVAFNKRVKSLTDSLFDSKWQPKMKELRRTDYNSDRAGRLMTELLISIDKSKDKLNPQP